MRLAPKGWASFQHYKDRNPPWIRLHKTLLDNYEFQQLPVASRALAPMLWLLASDSKDGVFDGSITKLAFRLRQTEKEITAALKPLIDNGFFFQVQSASKALAECKQDAVPEAETEEETETDSNLKVAPARQVEAVPDCPHGEILALWAECLPAMPQHLPSHWTGTRAAHLRARWRECAVEKKWPDQATGIAYFRKLFGFIGQSKFLTGRAPAPQGKRPFLIELEWLVNASNWAKTLEGKYHEEAA